MHLPERSRAPLLSLLVLSFLPFSFAAAAAQEVDPRAAIAGDALLNEGAYELLATLSDRFGPRMIGTQGHRDSLEYLEVKLAELGVATRRQNFEFPGWERGEARATLVEPLNRDLRVAALGYVAETPEIEGELVYVENDKLEAYEPGELAGKVLLLKPNLTFPPEALQELAERGVRGALLINRVGGGQLLARVANHLGKVPPFPLLSITQEEGLWLRRLLEEGKTARVRLKTSSSNGPMVGTNLIATIPGRTDQRVLLGGHFDSWDLGQGAMDNGLGVAQIYEVARLLSAHGPENLHTVELVWFDAEEFGLWGSRYYVEQEDLDRLRVMINLDMVGRPIAVNAMGFDDLVPPLEAFSADLGSWSFDEKVGNKPWLGSDHHPFIMEGVPAITFNAPIDADAVRHYHDLGDTFDKIDREMLGRSSAIVALLVYDLANQAERPADRSTPEETAERLRKAGLEERLKKAGQWPFDSEE